jgi:serine/threonine-protein kinase
MSDLTGELIDGRYQLIRQIGNGGMAVIYEALDTRLDRKVAVKIMHPHLAQDEEFVGRFIREAKAAAALSHPNIVAVQDQGWNQSGAPAVFLVMELIEGHTLRDFIFERGRFDVKDALNYLTPILSALAAAHRIGIVHRDIKPENILISKEGRVKIADFGLARGTLLGTTMTAESSIILGSVSYLSPEQVQRGVADSRSDVYATGIVAFEMLTGEKPFPGETPIQIAYMHVNEKVPAVSTKRKDIPPALDVLILRATSSNPDDRPRDAAEFLTELQKILGVIDPSRNQMSLELDLPVQTAKENKREKKTRPIREESIPKESTAVTRAKKRKISRRVRRNRWIAFFLAVAIGIGGWYALVGPGSRVIVPSVVGGTLDDATSAFSPLGITAEVSQNVFDEEIGKGKIISSDPAGGGRVTAGGSVKLTISKGPERFTVPNLQGLTPEAAQKVIEKFPLRFGSLTENFSSTIPAGFVIAASPVSGESVKRETIINIVVSKGVEKVELTSYLGKSGEQALNELTDAGFDVISTYEFNESVLSGGVITQSPDGNTPTEKGAKITLVISKGYQYVYIPNVYSLAESKAVKALKDLDLKVSVKKMGKKSVKSVTNIAPKVGTKVKRGSTVVITVG